MKVVSCEALNYPEVSSIDDIQKFFSISCFDVDILNWKELERNFEWIDSLFDFYSQEIEKNWPLPTVEELNCQESRVQDWRRMADQMVSLQGVELKKLNFKPNILSDSEIFLHQLRSRDKTQYYMLKNTLINAAYTRLVIEASRRGKLHQNQWLSSTALASATVGQSIRASLKREYYHPLVEANASIRTVSAKDNSGRPALSFLEESLEQQNNLLHKLGESNIAVFEDTFWQQLAAIYCGPSKAQELNQSLVTEAHKKIISMR